MSVMNKLTMAKAAALGGALLVASTAVAAAASPMPLSSQWRACDFNKLAWVPAVGEARMVANIGSAGSTVVAHVEAAVARPNAYYTVRIIQTPRPSIGCAPGDPGVVTGGLQVDAAGNGSVTVQGPIAVGKTGAWVVVDRPSEYSQNPAEFYTTEFIADI
jgi:hypothetical protein